MAVALLLPQFGLGVPALAAGGDLDPSFGVGGQITSLAFFGLGGGSPIAFQADGKIVVAGYVLPDPDSARERFAVARFGVDGTLDPTFGGDGIVTTIFRIGTKCYDGAKSVVVQSEQKIVAVGVSSCKRSEPGTGETDSSFALARYNSDGTLDTTFGDNGKVMTSFGDPARCNAQAEAAALEPDGRIVAAGVAHCVKAGLDSRFVVARYDTDGTLDTSFSADGKVQTNFTSQYDKLADVVVQPDGKIVVGGTAAYWMVDIPDALEERAALARYNLDGTLDSTFGGGDGKVTTSFHSRLCGGSNESYGLAIQPDGKIVEGGSAGCAATVGDSPHPRWAFVRYQPNGKLDPTFGGDGRVVTIFRAEACGDWMYGGVAIQANGKIVAAGTTGCTTLRFTLARYRTTGRLDSAFGSGGKVQTSFGTGPGCASGTWWGLAIQADQKIVASGGGGCLSSFVMARFLPS
jgi:uncharacterized delta-60 repeat protein